MISAIASLVPFVDCSSALGHVEMREVCVCMYMYMYVCMYVCMYVHMYVHVCMYLNYLYEYTGLYVHVYRMKLNSVE